MQMPHICAVNDYEAGPTRTCDRRWSPHFLLQMRNRPVSDCKALSFLADKGTSSIKKCAIDFESAAKHQLAFSLKQSNVQSLFYRVRIGLL